MAPVDHDAGEIVIHTALRGLAALCVVVYHVSLGFLSLDLGFRAGFAAHSYLFVDLFFLLSGYIICLKYRSWFADGVSRAGFAKFIALRFARIYPNFVVWFLVPFMVLGSVQHFVIGGLPPLEDQLVSLGLHIVMMQSLLDAPVVWNVPLWSIPVEMISYLLFPALVVVLLRAPQVLGGLVLILAFAALVIIASGRSIDVVTGPLAVVRGFAGFSIGAVLAFSAAGTLRLPDFALSALQIAALVWSLWAVHLGYEVTAIVGFVLLIYVTQENRGVLYGVLRRAPFHGAGLYSFSVYLAHTMLIFLINIVYYKLVSGPTETTLNFWVISFLAIGISLLVARFGYHWIELPMRRVLRARLVPRRSLAEV